MGFIDAVASVPIAELALKTDESVDITSTLATVHACKDAKMRVRSKIDSYSRGK